ncbi:MAG: helix-turn-helix domain-containing protein [Blastocatellia bacterium]
MKIYQDRKLLTDENITKLKVTRLFAIVAAMVEFRLEEVLRKAGKTRYWLAEEAGISQTTMFRYDKGSAEGVKFHHLSKICEALGCQPGDLLFYVPNGHGAVRRRSRSGPGRPPKARPEPTKDQGKRRKP